MSTLFLRGVQELAYAVLWRVCEHSRHLFPVKAGQKRCLTHDHVYRNNSLKLISLNCFY